MPSIFPVIPTKLVLMELILLKMSSRKSILALSPLFSYD
ncbi:MAG: hypothetical protein JETT_3815 [Candidatus Jettenia ecosi]|uniref:Uncharacterized protein n=1 Tax=Candidatus Jettenia ecosi TaxID=2494326 RepID=A0A533Q5U2_9BACT|nr:MAG: hypothetical protein JETT_3815 [Candidatus Jettenia ecosi]